MSDLDLADIAEQRGHRATGNGRHGCLPALVALALIVAIGLFAYVKGIDLMRGVLSGPDDYSGAGHGSVTVEVTEGQTATDVDTQPHAWPQSVQDLSAGTVHPTVRSS